MTVWEYLDFVARAKGLPRLQVMEEVKRTGFACGLEEVIGRPIKNLSKGYKQRVGIAQALIGDPDVVIHSTSPPWASTPSRSSRSAIW